MSNLSPEELIFRKLLKLRGLVTDKDIQKFIEPDYQKDSADPFLLADMQKAVNRLLLAHKQGELVYIYGDYDVDGLTASALLRDAFSSMDIKTKTLIPSRFDDGYGISKQGLAKIKDKGAAVVVSVDCGIVSFSEADYAKQLGLDLIITDHHTPDAKLPNAYAIIDAKRKDCKYPFKELAGVGVAFKLVQALQQHLDGLEAGQEKWLLDLVALGTVCDSVPLLGENRMLAHWGLKVIQQTRRPGLRALALVSGQELAKVNEHSLGFVFGPRLNAAGRLNTAELGLKLLTTKDQSLGIDIAKQLNELNEKRQSDQKIIEDMAMEQAERYKDQPVLVLSHPEWSHGIIGIVASRLQEKTKKPVFIMQELGNEAKGSARSTVGFSAVEALRAVSKHIIRGGGHAMAAGFTLETSKIPDFRLAINEYYRSLAPANTKTSSKPKPDLTLSNLDGVNLNLCNLLNKLGPFGVGNPRPIFKLKEGKLDNIRKIGNDLKHIKGNLVDQAGRAVEAIGFSMTESAIDQSNILLNIERNDFNGKTVVQARLISTN